MKKLYPVLLTGLVVVTSTYSQSALAFRSTKNPRDAMRLQLCFSVLDSLKNMSKVSVSRDTVLEWYHTDRIIEGFDKEWHGAKKNDNKYVVRRLIKIGDAVYDHVVLKNNAFYEPHTHEKSEGVFFIVDGFGYLIMGESRELVPYKPGDIIKVEKGQAHGFYSITETHFISLNAPGIKDDWGNVDIHF